MRKESETSCLLDGISIRIGNWIEICKNLMSRHLCERRSAILHEIIIFPIIIKLSGVESAVVSIQVPNKIMFGAMLTAAYISRVICIYPA